VEFDVRRWVLCKSSAVGREAPSVLLKVALKKLQCRIDHLARFDRWIPRKICVGPEAN
jgi:hypothetical protein